MKKHLLSAIILIAYVAILIKVMVFKHVPLIKLGTLMLNFGGTNPGHSANFVPFKTILPYLLGEKGLIIGGINLVGNIILLVPIGFLVPLVYRNMTWKKSLVLAAAAGLAIEGMQVMLRVGIFDIDDVILNALGVMIGYSVFAILAKWLRTGSYMKIILAVIVVLIAASSAFYAFYATVQAPMNSVRGPSDILDGGEVRDLCGGTGGNGQIVSREGGSVTIKRKDDSDQIIYFTSRTAIETPAGPGPASDLKIGDRITLIGGPNPDGSFTADAIVVCSLPGPEHEEGR